VSVTYVAVQWSAHKRRYDAILAGSIATYLLTFVAVGKARFRGDEAVSDPILLLRALGSCAFVLLHVILCIGPLARLSPRFLPLLYNRRHLGVATCLVALLHAVLVIGFYHGFGVVSPLVSLLTSNTNFGSLRAFPFELLGGAALLVMLLMAATSHDFWNRNLGAAWKRVHMLVYPAYALLVLHVALGALQAQRGALPAMLLVAGAAIVVALHLIAGARESSRDRRAAPPADDGWLDAGDASTIPDGRARVVTAPGGERIAVFRHGDRVTAMSNVCAHQGGPLGEGKIIDGCVTCPWHGWQYRAEDGQAPPPFNERVPVHCVRRDGDRVQVSTRGQLADRPSAENRNE